MEQKQRKSLWSFSKFITETAKSENWNIRKVKWSLAESIVLFFWRKLMNLLKPSITKILQHWTDDWGAGRKSKLYFPWVFICSSNQNNVRWITKFFIFSLNIAKLPKRTLGSHKEMTAPWEETALPTILARDQRIFLM